MLCRTSRLVSWSLCAWVGLLLISGCATKRSSSRVPRSGSRILQNITPGSDYNPPADTIPMTPPAPRDSDPFPPTHRTSDLPQTPPHDDFESAENPGRHSASFGPYTGRVTPASQANAPLPSSL